MQDKTFPFVDNGLKKGKIEAMKTVRLSDKTVEALQSQAAAQGMSLTAWLDKLANRRSAKPRYTLDQLMQQCDVQAPMSDEARAWLDDPPAGQELL